MHKPLNRCVVGYWVYNKYIMTSFSRAPGYVILFLNGLLLILSFQIGISIGAGNRYLMVRGAWGGGGGLKSM